MEELYQSNGVFVLNSSFEKLAFIDKYTSLIWIERYLDCGQFELYLPADQNLMMHLHIGDFVMRDCHYPKYSYTVDGVAYHDAYPELMVIEKITLTTDEENGNYIIVSGRTAESLFDRRVLYGTYEFINMQFVSVIRMVAEDQMMVDYPYPFTWNYVNKTGVSDSARIFPITEPSRGYNCYKLLYDMCQKNNFGMRVIDHFNSGYVFSLYFYKGHDRTRGNGSLNPVIFSPEYHNLVSSKYEFDTTDYKNAIYIASDGEWYQEKYDVAFYNGVEPTGYDFRQMFLKSNVPLKDSSGNERSSSDINNDLDQNGRLELLNHRPNESFDFDILSTNQFRYQHEYFLGDHVTVDNGFGISVSAKVVEVSQIWDENGYRIIPKLEVE